MSCVSEQALRVVENLTLPSVQVVVMNANMGCTHCRRRVTTVVSKMNTGLLDYMVDFGKKEVVVRGKVTSKKKKKNMKFPKFCGLTRLLYSGGAADISSALSVPKLTPRDSICLCMNL